MPIAHHRYHLVGPVLVRASTFPEHPLPPPPDPTATIEQAWAWLAAAWADPILQEAVTLATPDLAARMRRLVDAPGEASERNIRRAVAAITTYLMRWQRRATPFGLFAGVTTATVGAAAASFGENHRSAIRADADWLAQIVDKLDQDHELRRRLTVVADNSMVVRGGRVFVTQRPQPGPEKPGPVRETSTRCTRVVAAALRAATHPIGFEDLLARLCSDLHADRASVEALLHGLVDGRFLITGLRPPSTAVDGLSHVLHTLEAAGVEDIPRVAPTATRLNRVHTLLTQHNTATDVAAQAGLRRSATELMSNLATTTTHPLAADVRLDAEVRVSTEVLDEVARAAEVLLRLTSQPFGPQAWLDYHVRFRNRYGPGALVPVRELLADSGLGYPHGYLGTPAARPVWRTVTQRDVHLLRLVQQAMLDGTDEIRLSATDIAALTVGNHTSVMPPERIELGVTVHACSALALDRGDFELRIIGAPRTPTSMIGRFVYLLDASDRDRVAQTYTTVAEADGGAVTAQLSFPPRRIHNGNVTSTGRLQPQTVSIAEHPDGDGTSLDDLAVTADAEQLYLERSATGSLPSRHESPQHHPATPPHF
ncbi:hypothetical protein GCM10010112_82070 [Actinoplanes lobatus]|uniref:Lantibiotic dehydratase N-terminal domain-containing protein n=1 Tax=Actinoplanes lobatus TaxID=113568 RepID=A0A7W7HLD2_9ACTN|nr:lantibiotic dehydratase family protein [Actinoplanes lobatus]MBB4752621.1 hypothetical protein [Actinoplanes lobatus]GGN93626.1 hypothetical protein GCM10010112_82070 [Actinoplanes lobatus]GIE44714.1 hypothetical protein Alo02nite_76120 [Actinoplanes lobatus]